VKSEQRTEIPDWARYVANDGDGSAWAFESQPELQVTKRYTYWARPSGMRCVALATDNGAFRLADAAVSRLVFPLPVKQRSSV
jgi:hypothetical protein